MKKNYILFLFVTVLGLSISSCSSDSDNDDNASIVGKWEILQYGIGPIDHEIFTDRVNVTECGKDYIEFLSDGTYKIILFSKHKEECYTIEDNGKYIKNESTLSLIKYIQDSEHIIESEPANSEIIVLNKSTLKIRILTKTEKETVSQISIFKKI
ncbi:hypothetical protein OA88_05085 [Flavobacterium sp. JRM]|jgi:hypothetical protein|nr:hypothetical protein OA88_05085 [Flavobacterium sp. JRM]